MTGDTGLGVDRLAPLQLYTCARAQPCQRPHIVGHRLNVGSLEDAVTSECRHAALAVLALRRADAVADGQRDVLEASTPEPFVVEKIRVSLGAAASASVAWRA